jgi:hypothetical protein
MCKKTVLWCIAQNYDSTLCIIARSRDSVLCIIAWSCDSSLCCIAGSLKNVLSAIPRYATQWEIQAKHFLVDSALCIIVQNHLYLRLSLRILQPELFNQLISDRSGTELWKNRDLKSHETVPLMLHDISIHTFNIQKVKLKLYYAGFYVLLWDRARTQNAKMYRWYQLYGLWYYSGTIPVQTKM